MLLPNPNINADAMQFQAVLRAETEALAHFVQETLPKEREFAMASIRALMHGKVARMRYKKMLGGGGPEETTKRVNLNLHGTDLASKDAPTKQTPLWERLTEGNLAVKTKPANAAVVKPRAPKAGKKVGKQSGAKTKQMKEGEPGMYFTNKGGAATSTSNLDPGDLPTRYTPDVMEGIASRSRPPSAISRASQASRPPSAASGKEGSPEPPAFQRPLSTLLKHFIVAFPVNPEQNAVLERQFMDGVSETDYEIMVEVSTMISESSPIHNKELFSLHSPCM